ncbi:MAG: hypothetical protein ACRD6X_14605 [Pyrinomonadaceae bacterium]
MKMPENMTWARQVAVLCIFVTTFIAGFAFLLGHSVEAVISRFFSIEMVLSIFLVSISCLIYAPLRHQLTWVLVSVVPSLIWQPVGIPLILVPAFDPFDPFAIFSWIPALVTLAMTVLFWFLEKLEAKYIGASEEEEEIITLNLNED